MKTKFWTYSAVATLGPVIGWFAQDFYNADRFAIMGMAVFVSWSGFWIVKAWAESCKDE